MLAAGGRGGRGDTWAALGRCPFTGVVGERGDGSALCATPQTRKSAASLRARAQPRLPLGGISKSRAQETDRMEAGQGTSCELNPDSSAPSERSSPVLGQEARGRQQSIASRFWRPRVPGPCQLLVPGTVFPSAPGDACWQSLASVTCKCIAHSLPSPPQDTSPRVCICLWAQMSPFHQDKGRGYIGLGPPSRPHCDSITCVRTLCPNKVAF